LYEDIFGLDIAMVDCIGMQISQALEQLPDNVSSVLLRYSHFLLEQIPDLAVCAQLLQDIEVLAVREETIKLDDVRVFQA
jgi:hypothetical protein